MPGDGEPVPGQFVPDSHLPRRVDKHFRVPPQNPISEPHVYNSDAGSIRDAETAALTVSEIDGTHSFQENQRDTLMIHQGEIPSFVQNPTVAIVKRAYRELSNGNLTAQLDSFTQLQVGGNDLEAIIVVNNPRIMAILSELEPSILAVDSQEASRQLRLYYEQHRLSLSEWEGEFLTKLEQGEGKLERAVSTYKENQATLSVLRLLSSLGVKIQEGAMDESAAFMEADRLIPSLVGGGILDKDQLAVLLQVAKKVLKKKVIVLGIDCSSAKKGYKKVDLGQATNQGCHVAVSRGARYLDISDMDQFYPPESLNEIVRLSRSRSSPDVLYRPLRLITPQHPEQFKDVDWDTLAYYYALSAIRREKEWKYTYYRPEQNHDAVHNTGHIVISARAFERHQYPHNDWFEDLVFSRKMQTDPTLSQYQLLDSDLLLSDRGREESYDGSVWGRARQLTDIRAQIEQESLRHIHEWIDRDRQIVNFLQGEPALAHLLDEYESRKTQFLMLQNKERRAFRHVFFSPEGLVYKLFNVISSTRDIADADLERLNLTPQQRVFIKNNPALIPALRKEILEKSISNPEQLCSILETTLPEFFYPPIASENLTLPESDSQDDSDRILRERVLVNTSLWIHLYKSTQWLASRATNEQKASTYPASVNDKLDDLVKLLTRL